MSYENKELVDSRDCQNECVEQRWKFTTTVHSGYNPEKTEWYFEGTEEDARNKLSELIKGCSSPFVTFDYVHIAE